MKQLLRQAKLKHNSGDGFTIVELLVVIIVIAILAAITIVAYSGVTQSATTASLQSDLSNASTALKSFALENNSNFPTTISTDCIASPDTTTNKCLNVSNGNTYIGYSANNSSSPKTFVLIASNKTTVTSGSIAYKVTDSTAPTQVSQNMQPDVTPGAVLELHAAKANAGTSQGINSPLTTTWTDTSGNGNNGTLANFGTTTPWSGAGTSGDPYKLATDGTDDYINVPDSALLRFGTGDFTAEVWVTTPYTESGTYPGLFGKGLYNGFNVGSWGICGNSADLNRLRFRDVAETGSFNANFAPAALADGLHHLVFTRKAGSYFGYVDGVLASSSTPTRIANLTSTVSVRIGSTGIGVHYIGSSIPMARLYPFALTAAQAAANYNAGLAW